MTNPYWSIYPPVPEVPTMTTTDGCGCSCHQEHAQQHAAEVLRQKESYENFRRLMKHVEEKKRELQKARQLSHGDLHIIY